jgi:hypothetical protein
LDECEEKEERVVKMWLRGDWKFFWILLGSSGKLVLASILEYQP